MPSHGPRHRKNGGGAESWTVSGASMPPSTFAWHLLTALILKLISHARERAGTLEAVCRPTVVRPKVLVEGRCPLNAKGA